MYSPVLFQRPGNFNCLAGVLDKDEKQAKVVVEVFNPGRFTTESRKHRLIPGQAFDLELGSDLLKVGCRQEVRRYLQSVKPGLVIISPYLPAMYHVLHHAKHEPQTSANETNDLDMNTRVLFSRDCVRRRYC